MIDLIEEAQNIQIVCEENDWDFCFVGGLALQMWVNRVLLKILI